MSGQAGETTSTSRHTPQQTSGQNQPALMDGVTLPPLVGGPLPTALIGDQHRFDSRLETGRWTRNAGGMALGVIRTIWNNIEGTSTAARRKGARHLMQPVWAPVMAMRL